MSKELDKILEAAAVESAHIEGLRIDLSAAEKRLDALRAQAEKQLQADLAKLTPGKKAPPKNTRKYISGAGVTGATGVTRDSSDDVKAAYNEAMARS
jgi:hypothetical protein